MNSSHDPRHVGPYCQFHEFAKVISDLQDVFTGRERYSCLGSFAEKARLDANKAAIYSKFGDAHCYVSKDKLRLLRDQRREMKGRLDWSTEELDQDLLDEEARSFQEQFGKVIQGLRGVSAILRDWDSASQERREKPSKELYEFVIREWMGDPYNLESKGRSEQAYAVPAQDIRAERGILVVGMLHDAHEHDLELKKKWEGIMDQARFAQCAYENILVLVCKMFKIDKDLGYVCE